MKSVELLRNITFATKQLSEPLTLMIVGIGWYVLVADSNLDWPDAIQRYASYIGLVVALFAAGWLVLCIDYRVYKRPHKSGDKIETDESTPWHQNMMLRSTRSRRIYEFQGAIEQLKTDLENAIKALGDDKVFSDKVPARMTECYELVTLAVPEHTSLIKKTKELSGKEPSSKNVAELVALLETTGRLLHLQKPAAYSITDELALLAVGAEDRNTALECFETKRALYHSFAKSWPLRITLLLLLIALSLVGWRTLELASIGDKARLTAQKAQEDVTAAKKDLNFTKQSLLSLVAEAKADRVSAQESLKAATDDLGSARSKGVEEVNQAAHDGLEGILGKLLSTELSLKTDLEKAAQSGVTNIREYERLKMEELGREVTKTTNALNTAQADTLEKAASIEDDAKEKIDDAKKQIDLALAQNGEQINRYADTKKNLVGQALEAHTDLKKSELNTRTGELITELDGWQILGSKRVERVIERVETNETEWQQRSLDRATEIDGILTTLRKDIDDLNARYEEQIHLSEEIVKLAEQVSDESQWLKIPWFAAVLDWRTAIIIVLSLLSFLSLVLSIRRNLDTRFASPPL